jgi:hypothetical protein
VPFCVVTRLCMSSAFFCVFILCVCFCIFLHLFDTSIWLCFVCLCNFFISVFCHYLYIPFIACTVQYLSICIRTSCSQTSYFNFYKKYTYKWKQYQQWGTCDNERFDCRLVEHLYLINFPYIHEIFVIHFLYKPYKYMCRLFAFILMVFAHTLSFLVCMIRLTNIHFICILRLLKLHTPSVCRYLLDMFSVVFTIHRCLAILESDTCVVTRQAPKIESARPIRSRVTSHVSDSKMAAKVKNTMKQKKKDKILIFVELE